MCTLALLAGCAEYTKPITTQSSVKHTSTAPQLSVVEKARLETKNSCWDRHENYQAGKREMEEESRGINNDRCAEAFRFDYVQ